MTKRTEPSFLEDRADIDSPDLEASSRVRSLLSRGEPEVGRKANRSVAGGIISVGALCVIGYWLWSSAVPHFSDDELSKMKSSIKSEFEKREGLTVKEVVMLRETSTKATGFVKLDAPILGEVTKACSATMGDDWRYIWQCQ
jgi:hypothetical protein